MSLHRRDAKRDANEGAIVQALERCGWSVTRISERGAPDLLCARAGQLVLIEVKAKHGTLTPDQERWRQSWNGPEPLILRGVDDVAALMRMERTHGPR